MFDATLDTVTFDGDGRVLLVPMLVEIRGS